MRPVLDASATVSWYFEDQPTELARCFLWHVKAHGADVPAIWTLEVLNIMLRAERRRRGSLEVALEFHAKLREMEIHVAPQQVPADWPRLLELARRHGLTVYDATYLDLAIRLGAPLATLDQQLARAALAAGVPLVAATA